MRLETIRTTSGDRLTVNREGGNFALQVPANVSRALAEVGVDGVLEAAAAATDVVTGDIVAPLRPSKVVAIGLNYLDHIRETGMDRPERPLVFAKFPSSVIGPDEAIEIDPDLLAQLRHSWRSAPKRRIPAPVCRRGRPQWP